MAHCLRCNGWGYVIETWPEGADSLFPETGSGEFVCGARLPDVPAPEEPVDGICLAGCLLEACHRCGAGILDGRPGLCASCRAAPWTLPVLLEPRRGAPMRLSL